MYLRLNPYDEILRGMRVSLQIDEGIIKITGKSGSGKSALCRQLHADLQNDGQPALLFTEPPASVAALQDAIVDRL
ncbi:MAG TPA: AAA family ATPase, partial [Rhodocyclaceae bacterium]